MHYITDCTHTNMYCYMKVYHRYWYCIVMMTILVWNMLNHFICYVKISILIINFLCGVVSIAILFFTYWKLFFF